MKIERKYMAHYLNTNIGGGGTSASYVRLGQDLEEYSPELSANVEKKTNILGQTSVIIDSYQKQGEVSPGLQTVARRSSVIRNRRSPSPF